MHAEEIREYCLSKAGTEECFPFDETTLVFKVAGKMFLLLALDEAPVQFNVKCDPQKALQLREKHPCVTPGFHMNKKYWNTVICDGSVSEKLLKEWINHSYDEVVAKLSKKEKAILIGEMNK